MASGAVLESYLTFSHGISTGLVQWCDRRGHPRGKASWGGESMLLNRRRTPNQGCGCVLGIAKDLQERGDGQ